MQLPKWIWAALGLVVLIAFNGFFTPGFLSITVKDGHYFGSLIDILYRATPVMLVALGMTLVIATKGVDLSVGAVIAISGSLMASKMMAGMPFASALVFTLIICVLLGVWNGILVAGFNVQPMVATLILMVSGRGVAQIIAKGQIATFEFPSFVFLGNGFVFGLPFSVWLVAAVFVLISLLTRATALGLFIEASGDNETAAKYTGINVRSVKMSAYVVTALCAGIAGLVIAGGIKAADSNNAGLYLELDAILAVVIGGTSMNGGRFYLIGSVVGALFLQALVTTILAIRVPVEYILVVKAVAVIIICLLQSEVLRQNVLKLTKPKSQMPRKDTQEAAS